MKITVQSVKFLSSQHKSFTDKADGRIVNYYVAKILDNTGSAIFEASMTPDVFEATRNDSGKEGAAEFELYQGIGRNGHAVLKLRLLAFSWDE